MAKKPDFTQKLLEDLRMRKEHMAKSHNSNHSGQLVTERYRDFKHPYRKSREIGSTTRDMQKWSGKSNRSASVDMGESSKQLVPVGRNRGSEQIADLSMALAFAFQNGRDYRPRSSGNIMNSYLNHLDKNRRSSGQFPTLSHLHITEISRGAQKLNQILKACYNGLNFDIYSVDVGTELLRGALDLEESLKMLIELQEASEYMISPQRKQQKVRLLEMDDDGDESNAEVNKQKQIGLPRFSFDKPSKKSLEYAGRTTKNNSVKQKPLAISYHTEKPYLGSEKQIPTTSNLISHKRSVSNGAESSKSSSLSIIKKQSTSTESQSERGRIPNVIAKLMGLEELPPNKEPNLPPHKEAQVKQEARARNDSDRNSQRSGRKGEHPSIDFKKPAQRITTQKLVQAEKQPTVPDTTSLVVYIGKISQTSPETEDAEGKVHLERKKTEGARLLSNATKTTVKINKPEMNMVRSHPNKESPMEKMENQRKQENLAPKKQMKKGREEATDGVLKDAVKKVAAEAPKKSEIANGKQEWRRTEKDATSEETRIANRRLLMTYNHEKPPPPSHPARTLKKSNSQDAKPQGNNREQKKVKNQLQESSNDSQKKQLLINKELSSKKNTTEASATVPSRRSAECSNKEGITREKNPIGNMLKTRKAPHQILAEQKPSTRDSKADLQNAAVPTTQVARKTVHAQQAEKVNNIEVHNSMSPRGTQGEAIRDNDSASELMKEQTSIPEAQKYSSQSEVKRSEEADLRLNRSKEAGAQNQLLNSTSTREYPRLNATPQMDVECTSIVSTPAYPRLKDSEPSSTARTEDSTTTVSNSPNPSAISPHGHQIQDNTRNVSEALVTSKVSPTEKDPTSSDTVSIPIKGNHEDKVLGVSKSFQQEPRKHLEHYPPQQLTEEEEHLKLILINSQLFLNAAEALFGLLIPVEMLQSSDKKDSDNDNKLTLDCAYEVIKRKGRRRELIFHDPWANIGPGTSRIKCLDDLVKDLHGDLKTLYPEHESGEHDAANSLREMLQKDLQNNKPDVNCMWDLEWGAAIYAYTEKEEVAKDIEKHVLNRLLDEYTREMLQITTVA